MIGRVCTLQPVIVFINESRRKYKKDKTIRFTLSRKELCRQIVPTISSSYREAVLNSVVWANGLHLSQPERGRDSGRQNAPPTQEGSAVQSICWATAGVFLVRQFATRSTRHRRHSSGVGGGESDLR